MKIVRRTALLSLTLALTAWMLVAVPAAGQSPTGSPAASPTMTVPVGMPSGDGPSASTGPNTALESLVVAPPVAAILLSVLILSLAGLALINVRRVETRR